MRNKADAKLFSFFFFDEAKHLQIPNIPSSSLNPYDDQELNVTQEEEKSRAQGA